MESSELEGNDDEVTAPVTAAANRTRPHASPRVEREREGASAALVRGIGAAAIQKTFPIQNPHTISFSHTRTYKITIQS